jgi:hypothetical protein
MGGHTNTGQALNFMVIDTIAQGGYDWDFDRCGFFGPGTTELRKSAKEWREARFMIFAIKPRLVPSLE